MFAYEPVTSNFVFELTLCFFYLKQDELSFEEGDILYIVDRVSSFGEQLML